MERAATIWKPNNLEISHTCPRCGSINTKFCYYNNYSLTQPRYFCKGCRRYWTKGGSLRNVPIGGGCRKSRRGKSSSISGTSSNNGLDNRRLFIDPESSSDGPTSPTTANIDLAAVYANFMNQKPQPQPSHIIQETPANNNDGPSFEFSGYPTMLNMDYFVPENGLAHNQDGGFIMGEYGNQAGLFHEQFCNNNNNNNSDINMMSSLPPILPDIQEEGIGIGIGIGWPNDNSDINMMFHNKSGVIEPAEVQGCPNHHTNNSSSSLFSIPSYESIFRP